MNYFNYFTEIEETFIRRRNKHLLLSPLDWALIESWKQIGIPLHVVLRGVEQAFDSHEKKRHRRSVKTLFYCQEEVEAQFAEWLETRVGAPVDPSKEPSKETKSSGGEDSVSEGSLPFPRAEILEHLKKCSSKLEQAKEFFFHETSSHLKDLIELREALARIMTRLAELADDFASAIKPNAEALEISLSQLEDYLMEALQKSIDPEYLVSICAAAEKELRPVVKHMQAEMRARLVNNMTQKLLREEFCLPRFSLFHL